MTVEDTIGVFADEIARDVFVSVPTARGVTKADLSNAISEVTVQTQTSGVPVLTLELIDPAWKIVRSGICDTDDHGLLHQVDVNYPPGTPVWWRLAMVTATNDLSGGPNLTLTFQNRVVTYLQTCVGPFAARPGTRTRAQFIKSLVDRAPREIDHSVLGPGGFDVKFICPELKVVQPVESEDPSTPSVTTAKLGADGKVSFGKSASINKTRGAGAGAANALTVKGHKITQGQLNVANVAVARGTALGAPENAIIACLYAGMGESNLGDNPRTFDPSAVSVGVWQGSPGVWGDGKDVAAMADSFYQGGKGFQAGGAIKLATSDPDADPWRIANAVEANAVWNESKRDSYGGQFPHGTNGGQAEAAAILAACGAGILGTTTAGTLDVGQLSRGQGDSQLEDSWTCMQRLAGDVNWDLFVCPQPHPGHWGNYLYYISAHELAASKPSLYIEQSEDGTDWTATTDGVDGNTPKRSDGVITQLDVTTDNTAFVYQQNRTASGKPSKKRTGRPTRVRTPQTPTQVRFSMLAGVMEFNAGDVFVFHRSGPLNGRWIVEDVTHATIQDQYAQFTLGPPTVALPEPQAAQSGEGGLGAASLTGLGTLGGAAEVAMAAVQNKSHLTYAQVRPIQFSILGSQPVEIDCSGFVIACYKAAGLPDPSGNGYNGAGNTDSIYAHCRQISQGDAAPGDFVFFGANTIGGTKTSHVNLYVGNNKSVNMGRSGDPSIITATAGPMTRLGFFRSNFIKNIAAPTKADTKPKSKSLVPGLDNPFGSVFGSKLH